jgi:hypothetical protein
VGDAETSKGARPPPVSLQPARSTHAAAHHSHLSVYIPILTLPNSRACEPSSRQNTHVLSALHQPRRTPPLPPANPPLLCRVLLTPPHPSPHHQASVRTKYIRGSEFSAVSVAIEHAFWTGMNKAMRAIFEVRLHYYTSKLHETIIS